MITFAWLAKTLTRVGLLTKERRDDGEFKGACQDTRRLRAGQLFVALSGEHTRGDLFAHQALEQGAAAVLLGDPATYDLLEKGTTAPLFLTPDPLRALQELARVRVATVAPRIVAVTGSNGKTTTKDICRCLFETIGPSFASEGNYNNLIGLPMTLLGLPSATELLILEMGCSSFGEIARMCELFRPEIGIVTNIGAAHLEILGDLAGVARAKGELPAALPETGLLLLPDEEPYAETLAGKSTARCRRFGFTSAADTRITDLGLQGHGGRAFRIGDVEGEIRRPARHTLLSLSAAWAAAVHLGGDPARFPSALEQLRSEGDRGVVYRLGDWLLVDDSYNANPASMSAALGWLREASCTGRRWAVLGDMLELGEQSDELHRALGVEVAEGGIDGLWTCGELVAATAEGARAAGLSLSRHFTTHAELTEALLSDLAPGDMILLKGSRGAAMECVAALLEEKTGYKREALN